MDNNNGGNNGEMKGKTCHCGHHKTVPIIIILIGLDILLGSLQVLTAGFVAWSWPVLLIIGGIVKLVRGRCKCC